MKLRSFFTILASVVIALLLVGLGGLFWLVSGSPLVLLKGGKDATPAAVMFVPKQAPVVTSLLVNPERLVAFRQLVAKPEERRRVRAELKQLQQSLLASTGLNYERDIQPWLGNELTLAVTTLDIDRDRANGQQPGYLLAMATKDPERSREFLQAFWQKRAITGTDLMFEQYKGVKLIYGSLIPATLDSQPRQAAQAGKSANRKAQPTDLPPLTLASAVVGDKFVLFANSPKVLRDAITNVQAPDLSLNTADFYDQALATLTQPRIGLTFVNLPRLAELLSVEAGATKVGQATSGTAKEPTYQTLAIALEVKRQGLMAETALVPTSGKGATVPPTLSQPVKALQYIPGNSLFSASGSDLNRLWTQLSDLLSGYPAVAQLVNQPVMDLQKQWQIDLPKDVFAWTRGEYAVGLLPAIPDPTLEASGKGKKGRRKASQPVVAPPAANEWVFVAHRGDGDASAKAGIEHLDAIAQKQGLSAGNVTLGNQTVSAWTRLSAASSNQQPSKTLQAEVRGVHGAIGNYEVFASSIAAMDQALGAIGRSLMTTPGFQRSIEPILRPNNGYLYIDWDQSAPVLERQFPLLKVVELAGQPFFKHLRSLTVSSYGQQEGVRRGGIFFRLS
jgi:hypothetical protein